MRSYQDWEKDFRRNYRPGSPHKKNTGECYYLQFCVKTRVTSEENCSGGCGGDYCRCYRINGAEVLKVDSYEWMFTYKQKKITDQQKSWLNLLQELDPLKDHLQAFGVWDYYGDVIGVGYKDNNTFSLVSKLHDAFIAEDESNFMTHMLDLIGLNMNDFKFVNIDKTIKTGEVRKLFKPDPSIEKKNISVIVRVPSMEDTILSLAPMGTEEWIINLK